MRVCERVSVRVSDRVSVSVRAQRSPESVQRRSKLRQSPTKGKG